jgi:hypothetical protein
VCKTFSLTYLVVCPSGNKNTAKETAPSSFRVEFGTWHCVMTQRHIMQSISIPDCHIVCQTVFLCCHMQICCTEIVTLVLCGCRTLFLIRREEERFGCWKNRALTRIFRPEREGENCIMSFMTASSHRIFWGRLNNVGWHVWERETRDVFCLEAWMRMSNLKT